MSTENSVAQESAATTRRIEDGRLTKALTQDMDVREHAPGMYDVRHGDETYVVDVEGGSCQCKDHQYRGDAFVCKHAIAASVHHVFVAGVDTRLVARVVGAVRERGCVHGDGSITADHDCEGPLGRGVFPCPACVRATPGDWTAWQTLVEQRPESVATGGESTDVAMTDGGTVEADTKDLADRLERAAAKIADVSGFVEHADMARELTNQRREIEAVAEELGAGQ